MQDFKQGRGMHSSCLEQKSKSFIQSMENNDNLMKKKKNLGKPWNSEREGGEREDRSL